MTILVDSNVPMYLIGAPHPHKNDAIQLLGTCVARRHRLVTDAEVFQEILHRYVAINRRAAVEPAFEALLGLVDEIFAVDSTAVQRAKEILLSSSRFSARNAIHLAVMHMHRVGQILSFDRAFDGIPGVERLGG